MNPYLAGFFVGILIVDVAVVLFLLRRISAQDRRLAELESIVGDEWEADEPVIDWQACLTGPALATLVHGINDRQHAMELWEAEQEAEQEERDYDSAA